MNVSAQDRLWWSPPLTAKDSHGTVISVPVTAWEASIDGGVTWVSSSDDSGSPGWLVAGKDFPGPGDSDHGIASDFVLLQKVKPRVRLRDNPETTSATSKEWLIPV